MGASIEPNWISSENTAGKPFDERSSGGARSSASSAMSMSSTKTDPSATGGSKRQEPVQVRVRNAAPPDPELLSKIGCRCLVIDFPGVLYENIAVSYIGGFVRVEGKRTVGRVKSFRKKFQINHEQVVTRMLSAFLCQGVLVIVAPTKVAAAIAAAAIVASQLIAKGYSFPTHQTPNSRLLLLQDPAATPGEEPEKSSNSILDTTTTSGIFDYCEKSAFEPYVPTRTAPFDDEMAKAIPFDEAVDEAADEPVQPIEQHPAAKPDEGSPVMLAEETLHDQPVIESQSTAPPQENNTQEPEKQRSVSPANKEIKSASSSEEHEKAALWSDDSLRGEPSVSATKSLRIMESLYIDNLRDEHVLSPILEHPYQDAPYGESPDVSQSSGRPLTWVQFETAWQEKEESLMVDSADNHSRIERLHEGRRKAEGTTARVGVPIMLPFEDELVDNYDHSLRMELEPHPYWRSAPFLPRLSDQSRSSIDSPSMDAIGPALAYRDPNLHRKEPPSPSLRRRGPSPTISGTRKSVTWVDEI